MEYATAPLKSDAAPQPTARSNIPSQGTSAALAELIICAIAVLFACSPRPTGISQLLGDDIPRLLASPDCARLFQTVYSLSKETNGPLPESELRAIPALPLPSASYNQIRNVILNPDSYSDDQDEWRGTGSLPAEFILAVSGHGKHIDIAFGDDFRELTLRTGKSWTKLRVGPGQNALKRVIHPLAKRPSDRDPAPNTQTQNTQRPINPRLTNLLTASLAYESAARAAMLAEINFAAERLGIDLRPITNKSLRLEHIANFYVTGFGGTFETKDFTYIFFKSGRLTTISRNHDTFAAPSTTVSEKHKDSEVIATNECYLVASNWADAVSIDVQSLQRQHLAVVSKVSIPVRYSRDDTPVSAADRIPVIHVDWGPRNDPALRIAFVEATKEFLALYMKDESFSRRPKELLRNPETLLAIPDSDFKYYSPSQKISLVSRFALSSSATNFFLDPLLSERNEGQLRGKRVKP